MTPHTPHGSSLSPGKLRYVIQLVRGGPEIATENIERILMSLGLNLSKGLSPPVRGHYRKRATLTCSQKLKFPARVPDHIFRTRASASELYGSTHNDGVREAKFDRI